MTAAAPHPALRRGAGHVTVWLWGVLAVALIAAGFLGLDRWFYEHVSLTLNSENVERDFYHRTKLFWELWRGAFGYGSVGLLVGVAIVVLNPARWRVVVVAFIAVALTALLANVAQGAIGRLRPNQADSHLAFTRPFEELLTKQRVCFPSGEAATAFAVACALTHLLPRWKIPCYAAAAVAAIARLVNGAHYISDVAAGALFGVLAAEFLFRRLGRWINPAAPPAAAQ